MIISKLVELVIIETILVVVGYYLYDDWNNGIIKRFIYHAVDFVSTILFFYITYILSLLYMEYVLIREQRINAARGGGD